MIDLKSRMVFGISDNVATFVISFLIVVLWSGMLIAQPFRNFLINLAHIRLCRCGYAIATLSLVAEVNLFLFGGKETSVSISTEPASLLLSILLHHRYLDLF